MVPFTLIGQPVEVRPRDGVLEMRHRGQVVATHPLLGGRHQLRILPEHGPGPIARNARVRYSTGGCSTEAVPLVRRTPTRTKKDDAGVADYLDGLKVSADVTPIFKEATNGRSISRG